MVLRQARAASEHERADLDQARTELQAQLGVVTSWWKEVHHVLEPIQENLSAARKTIEDIGDRVREALYPLTGLIGTIGEELIKLSQISSPPPIPRPDPEPAKRVPGPSNERLTVSIEGQPPGRSTQGEGVAVHAGQRTGRSGWWPNAERSPRETGL